MPALSPAVMGAAAMANIASGVVPTFRINKGFASTAIVRTGLGDYTLTLNDACQLQTEAAVVAAVNHNAFAMLSIEYLTTTTLRTRTATATTVPVVAAADVDYWIAIFRTGPQ